MPVGCRQHHHVPAAYANMIFKHWQAMDENAYVPARNIRYIKLIERVMKSLEAKILKLYAAKTLRSRKAMPQSIKVSFTTIERGGTLIKLCPNGPSTKSCRELLLSWLKKIARRPASHYHL